MAEKKKKEHEEKSEISFDLSLGGLLGGFGNLVSRLSDLAEHDQGSGTEKKGEFFIKGLGDDAKGVFGFSIRTGLGGTTHVERFGNIHSTDEGPQVAEAREPLVDLFDEGDEVLVVVELPGASGEEVEVRVEEDILSLETTGAHKYAKEILLPAAVEAGSLRRSYHNGILELRMRKEKTT